MVALVVLALLGQAPHVWNVPEVIDVVDAPGRTEAGGVPVAMHAVRSKASAETLIKVLEEQFSRAGLYLPPANPQLSVHAQVTGLDVDRQIAYTAFLQRNADKTVTVIFTETFMKERKAQAVPEAPVMPGATQVLTSKAETLSSVSYRVKATPEEVRRYYTEVMAAAGFKPSASHPLKFANGKDVWSVSARSVGAGLLGVSVVRGVDPAAQ